MLNQLASFLLKTLKFTLILIFFLTFLCELSGSDIFTYRVVCNKGFEIPGNKKIWLLCGAASCGAYVTFAQHQHVKRISILTEEDWQEGMEIFGLQSNQPGSTPKDVMQTQRPDIIQQHNNAIKNAKRFRVLFLLSTVTLFGAGMWQVKKFQIGGK